MLRIFLPEESDISFAIMKDYSLEVLAIFPPVLILMGLADVWIPRAKIKKYLGEGSGITGILISMSLGTLPADPMFIAFPIVGEMIRKGARI